MGGVTALRSKPSFLVDGDASIMMHLAEFETMVRYKMPLLVVCMNNESLGSGAHKLDAHKMMPSSDIADRPDAIARRWAAGASRAASTMCTVR